LPVYSFRKNSTVDVKTIIILKMGTKHGREKGTELALAGLGAQGYGEQGWCRSIEPAPCASEVGFLDQMLP